MTSTADIAALFAPAGALRASINLGNPILAHAGAGGGAPGGVSVDMARELARRLERAVAFVVFDTAAQSVQAVREERADVGFFAVDPLRGEGIAFSAPYVLIEGAYLVRADSPLADNAEVDRPGRRVVVGRGSAYDLFLTRTLHAATIERAPSSPAVVEHFVAAHADVAAGVRQQLEADARRLGGLRLLPGRFMLIQQAMGLPVSRGSAAAAWLAEFVEDLKAGGFVAAALARHGIQGASVAPAARRGA
ncbi:MAG: ABC transporter substrate-binding protein [Pseudomonadota bacterium]|nr:transporter substrate-binding domain-containing protein [Rubrivivax sp.]